MPPHFAAAQEAREKVLVFARARRTALASMRFALELEACLHATPKLLVHDCRACRFDPLLGRPRQCLTGRLAVRAAHLDEPALVPAGDAHVTLVHQHRADGAGRPTVNLVALGFTVRRWQPLVVQRSRDLLEARAIRVLTEDAPHHFCLLLVHDHALAGLFRLPSVRHGLVLEAVDPTPSREAFRRKTLKTTVGLLAYVFDEDRVVDAVDDHLQFRTVLRAVHPGAAILDLYVQCLQFVEDESQGVSRIARQAGQVVHQNDAEGLRPLPRGAQQSLPTVAVHVRAANCLVAVALRDDEALFLRVLLASPQLVRSGPLVLLVGGVPRVNSSERGGHSLDNILSILNLSREFSFNSSGSSPRKNRSAAKSASASTKAISFAGSRGLGTSVAGWLPSLGTLCVSVSGFTQLL